MTDPPETATAERLIGPTQSSTVMPSATASAMWIPFDIELLGNRFVIGHHLIEVG